MDRQRAKMPVQKKTPKPTTQRTTSILSKAGDAERMALAAVQAAYASACKLLEAGIDVGRRQ
jgi:hypothetical protein